MLRITAIALCVLATLFPGARAGAHPLGNFTINHLARIEPDGNRLHVRYVLDIAEIPTFQIMHASGAWTPESARRWRDAEAQYVAGAFELRAGGTLLPLHLERSTERTRPGAGGLPILYWTGDYSAVVRRSAAIVAHDSVYADRRIGWKDIVLPGSSDPTDELRAYPSAVIGSPRQNDEATFDLRDGRISHVRISGDAGASWGTAAIVRSSLLSDLVARGTQTPLLVLLTILAAFGLGALHGLEPGHGKALLAFTLVGSRATVKQAAILAAALTFAHTIAVVLLGVLLFAAAGFATERIFSWITLLSGVAVVVIGARSLSNALAHAVQHRRGHDHHHGHDHAHDHAHGIAGTAPLQFRAAVVAAMSGGVAPCPAAIVVLLTALHLHRIGYGLLLIVIFSLGLAAILGGLGLAVVRGAAWLGRRSEFSRISRIAPFATATIVSIIGSSMLAQGLADEGVRVSAPAITAFALLIIAAFAVLPTLLPARSTQHSLVIKESS